MRNSIAVETENAGMTLLMSCLVTDDYHFPDRPLVYKQPLSGNSCPVQCAAMLWNIANCVSQLCTNMT